MSLILKILKINPANPSRILKILLPVMSELALQLIRENKKTKATSLDLGLCGMTEVPEEIGELVWLEELILSDEWFEYEFEKKRWDKKNSPKQGWSQ
ncbi:MAG: hypothetical protein IPH31_11770 [Lewinellaceae bacterium]|nr:hypothetical protein [Lewinellaceae bacterium]